MANYKVLGDPFPHFLSDSDFANGGDAYLPLGALRISDKEAESMRLAALPPGPSIQDLRNASIEKVKELRRQVFSALAGIQSEALASGDSVTASGIIPVQEALRNLPQTDLSACQTQADIDAAFLNAWVAIVAITPESVRTAFNGVL